MTTFLFWISEPHLQKINFKLLLLKFVLIYKLRRRIPFKINLKRKNETVLMVVILRHFAGKKIETTALTTNSFR